MANIQERVSKDGKVSYRVQVRLKGYPSQTASFKRKTDAKRWAQQIETAIVEGRHFKTAESKKRTLSELIDRYIAQVLPNKPKSLEKQRAQLLWWKRQLGAYVLADITPALVAEYRDRLLGEITCRGKKRSNSTVVRYLAALSHAFTVAVREWGWIEDSPLRRVSRPKEPGGRVRFLDTDERIHLLETCKESRNPFLYPIVTLAIATGMRRAEILNLTWGNVDFERSKIVLMETKNGDKRIVPLSSHTKAILLSIREQSADVSFFVFPRQKGQKPQKPIDIRTAWEIALAKAEIRDFKFHDLRHCCASYLLMNGASLAEISEVLGHRTLAMVKRYAHMSEGHAAKIVSKMNENIFG
ncbi:MAG: Tyrosine recombinase XerD [Chlamydiae bacterium]|nr:Tyrosine recombinase XerD [Chlamydiota bacterium]